MRPLIAGNWKMNGLSSALSEIERLIGLLSGPAAPNCDAVICPPATLLDRCSSKFAGAGVSFGGQDCHAAVSGAHTGDVSAEMLADAGARFVIVGHSERRADYGESDAIVRRKASAGQRAGLTPIICVGETEAERRAGKAEAVVSGQLAGSIPPGGGSFVIAYEPVWAIGTGLTPTIDDIADMHALIRHAVGLDARILYGGSVKPSNAADILRVHHVNGALVGGASLKADDFAAIIRAA